MEIPLWLSYAGPVLPVGARFLVGITYQRAAARHLGAARRTDEHRTLIVALAGFSLAGLAIIATQTNPALGPPLLDITISFVCLLGALAVQGWKTRWWQDLFGDALRDAAMTALLLFVVRLSAVAGPVLRWPPEGPWVVAALAGLVWLLEPVIPLLILVGVFRDMEDDRGRDG